MSRVDLPDGGWAEIADPKTITARARRPVHAAFEELARISNARESGIMVGREVLNETITVALTSAWSYGTEITLETVADLRCDVHDALVAACSELEDELLPDFGVSPDPKATTTDSSSSNPG